MNPLLNLLTGNATPKGPRMQQSFPPAPAMPITDAAFDQRHPAPRAMPAQQNPLMKLLSGGGNWRNILRAAGAGMANAQESNDPFVSLARGFGGATGHYDQSDAAKASAATDSEKTMYERSQDSADMALRKAAEERLRKSSELANSKTAAEIERLARQNGLTVSQMLEIERIAQAAGESEYDPARRRTVVEKERKRLMDQYGSGEAPRDGISEKSSGISPEDVTATGPNGEKAVLRDNQWVDPETGDPL